VCTLYQPEIFVGEIVVPNIL